MRLKTRHRSVWSHSTALLLGMMATSPAWASGQDQGADTTTDIVVTAQRRAESLTEVPATVSIVTSEKLARAGLTNSLELSQVTPGVSIDPRGAFAQPTIRGIGTFVTSVGSASNVGIYQDGIYQFAQRANVFYFDEIDSVQILKGAQGTLYGRNATGGAILIQTRRPTFDANGEMSVSYGRFNETVAVGYLNAPLSSKLAVNLTGSYRYADGYNYDLVQKVTSKRQDDYMVRGRMLWKPADGAELLLTVDHMDLRNPGALGVNIRDGNTQARFNNPNIVIATEPRTIALSFVPVQTTKSTGVTLEGNLETGLGKITSLTGWRSVVGFTDTDSDATPAALSRVTWHETNDTFSQELLLASEGHNAFSYLVGAAFNSEIGKYDPYGTQGVVRAVTRIHNTAYSGFVDLTYGIADKLFLTGGVRYTSERTGYTGAPGFNLPLTVNTSARWGQWTPRATIRYTVADNANIYASYNKGFKSGGYNSSSLSPVSYDPETVDAFEIGLKSRPMRGVSVDISLYDYEYKNIQFNASVASTGASNSTIRIYNAASARIRGADLSVIAQLSRAFRIDVGLAYTDGRYVDFRNALLTTPIFACGTGPSPCGNTQYVGDATGRRTVRTPEFTGSLGVSYTREIGVGTIDVSGNLFYSSGYFGDPAERLKQNGYAVLNANIGWTAPGGKFRVSAYGRNLTNALYSLQLIDAPLYDTQRFAPPVTYGLAFNVKF
jgi:iron complex outermembrane receptor protein